MSYSNEPDTLDLHGCTSHEARLELDRFVHDAQASGVHEVRIIVGKGTNSPDGEAVIPNVVKAYLAQNGHTFMPATTLDGGAGALDVHLR